MTAPPLFISYSRRQLYFAESLVLHLQANGQDVWFDLQQLHAGSAWADGLQRGVSGAERLLLVVSRASIESPFTRAEWQASLGRGAELVLVVFEDVDLPAALQGLPTFDFRAAFDQPLRRLVEALAGRAPMCVDRITPSRRLGLPWKLPPMLWAILAALALPLFVALPALVVALVARGPLTIGWLALCAAGATGIVLHHALPFWRRSSDCRRLSKGLQRSLLLGVATMLPVAFFWPMLPLAVALALAWLGALGLSLFALRHSATLLRWMPPDEDLQPLRRRVQQALLAAGEARSDGAPTASAAPTVPAGTAFRYALHAARADLPLARRVERILAALQHRRVGADELPDHHLALLSNRSSQAWLQRLTRAHAGRLVCIVASTIELGDGLADAARLQWVDFRDGDRRDIESLARSLVDPRGAQRRSALEITPQAIDQWKVPRGIRLLRSATELFGAYVLVFALTDLAGTLLTPWLLGTAPDAGGLLRSLLLAATGVVLLVLASQAMVYRRVPAGLMYPLLVGATVVVVLQARVLPGFLQDRRWLPLAAFLPFVGWSLLDGRHWLPGWARRLPDEVGIKRSIERAFHRRNLLVVGGWVGALVLAATAIGLTLPRQGPAG